MISSPLKAIICGYEKSGTTLLNEILRRHPNLESGFEGGFLLADSPRDFDQIRPYYGNFRRFWKLSREDMQYICDTDRWDECYRRARERAPFIEDKTIGLFDKTPIYMLHLSDVLRRIPEVPCVVNVRDPRAVMLSWANWSGGKDDPEAWIKENIINYCQRYNSYADGYLKAEQSFSGRILLNQFEHLAQNPELYAKRIFDFLGLEFSKDFLTFSSEYFVYGGEVSDAYVFPYREVLSDKVCDEIIKRTKRHSQWFYD